MASRPTRKPGPAGPSQPTHAAIPSPVFGKRRSAAPRATSNHRAETSMPTTGAAAGAGGEVVPAIGCSSPARSGGARGRAAPHRPPLSMQAYAPRRPGPAASGALRSLGYRSASVVGPRGSGASSPAPGVPAVACPSGRNRLPAPSSSGSARALPAKIQRQNLGRLSRGTRVRVVQASEHRPGSTGSTRGPGPAARVAPVQLTRPPWVGPRPRGALPGKPPGRRRRR